MQNWHKETILVDETNLDFNLTVPITELIKFFQIATFKHSTLMGLDHVSMKKNSNAFWIVTKMKVLPKHEICNNEKIKITTWTHELGMVRAVRDCVIKSNNIIKAKCSAEWCCLDMDTRHIRKMNSIIYPNLEMKKTDNINATYTNMKVDINSSNYVYTYMVRATDVDVNNHTNNLRYNFMVFNAFTVNEFKSIQIKEYEIYFVNESYEHDKIDIYKKKIKNYYYIEGKKENSTIFKSVIKFKNK